MAETSTMNSEMIEEQGEKDEKEDTVGIKCEGEGSGSVRVKREALECAVCLARGLDGGDMFGARTAAGASLHAFLVRFTRVDFAAVTNCSKFVCRSCCELINVLEQAEIEYVKLKEAFEAIISKNPLFETPLVQPIQMNLVKAELDPDTNGISYENLNDDSDDEPLATQRKKRRLKGHKKKKVVNTTTKRKGRSKNTDSWWCPECDTKGTGGDLALAAHKLARHSLEETDVVLKDVKTEDSGDGSQEPLFNNGLDNCLKVEVDEVAFEDVDDDFPDDDDDDDFMVEPTKTTRRPGRPSKSNSISSKPKIRKPKVMHECDECDAKYSSLSRLEQHKQKHDGSGPPYICEVCGAHYKHKRACDIHVALHKGISDWKCEECDKLFPSKNALARHNNIHTGKLNYQCDLCGKSFIHTSSFKMHKLSHSGVKPHACDVCGLALMTRSHLKRHKRVHSGEKRHECAVCGKRFSERYNLAAHSKSHEAPGEAPVAAPPRRRLFRCNFCIERFERRYMLERHMNSAHGRTLERPPPTPRNTMSKLLKAQAQRRDLPPLPTPSTDVDTKDDRSSDSRATPITPQKLIAQLSSSTSILASGAWAGSYAAEFGLRHDYQH